MDLSVSFRGFNPPKRVKSKTKNMLYLSDVERTNTLAKADIVLQVKPRFNLQDKTSKRSITCLTRQSDRQGEFGLNLLPNSPRWRGDNAAQSM